MENAELFLKKQENIEIRKDLKEEQFIKILKDLETKTKWQIFKMLEDIKSNIAKSYSVSRDVPKSSLFIYGGEKDILIKIEINKAEAKISIPRNIFAP